MARDMLSGQGDEKDNKSQQKSNEEENASFSFGDIPIDFETISRISSIISKLNSRKDDKRCEFLLSLKPLLSKPRQQRIDNAVQILKLIDLLPLLQETE